MNKKELVERVFNETGGAIPRPTIESILKKTTETIRNALGGGDKVVIKGFGTFKVGAHRARKHRNPGTGDVIMTPDRLVPKFEPAASFREELNGTGQKDYTVR